MRKLLLILAISLFAATPLWAQGIEVVGFKLLDNDLTANTLGTMKRDQNGEKAALIKIGSPEKGFSFDGGSLGIVGDVVEKTSELWLYVPDKAQKLTISHPEYGVLRDYYYPVPIKGGCTYEMLIGNGTGRFVTITASLARSKIYIDGEYKGIMPIYDAYLSFGTHRIEARKSESVFVGETVVTISPTDKEKVIYNIEMHNVYNLFGTATISVVGRTQGDIIFDGEKVATGKWTTELREGDYNVEIRPTDCSACETKKFKFSVFAQQSKDWLFSIDPTFSEYAKKQVTNFLSTWQKKKEFETTQQWQSRVTEDNRKLKIKEQLEIAKQQFITLYKEPFNPTLGTYDADYNLFPISTNGQTLYVQVPMEDAKQFKEKWGQVQFFPEYGIVDEHVGIIACTFQLKKKTYGLKQTSRTDSSTDISLDLPPVNFDEVIGLSNTTKQDKVRKVEVDRSIDQDIPVVAVQNSNTFAVIIGNEKYQQVMAVPFANNDARVFAEYCKKTLGLPDKNVRIYENATYGTMLAAVSDIQKIARAYKGDISVIFYYAGHGIPDESTGDAYLLPVDGDGINMRVCYPLNQLYKELGDLKCKGVTCFMDCCFSGAERGNGMVVAARGVAIKAKADAPQGNTVVFTAATDKQTAFPFEEKGHGMFTYYLLKKLRDTKGDCTLGELGSYVSDEVAKQAVVTNGKEQTPVVLTSAGTSSNWKAIKLK